MEVSFLADTLANLINIYLLLIIIRVLLSWFQSQDWAMSVMGLVGPLTDPYLNLFRSVIPPLGGIDISPILAIFLLQFVGSALTGL
ncbi:MAG: YggT family protein [Cyanobacteria bacterium P01_H01_bin.15]